MKYEVDKYTGFMHVDRPQRSSSYPPAIYEFIPRTCCGDNTSALNPNADKDPLDICVISEHPISSGEIILRAKVCWSNSRN